MTTGHLMIALRDAPVREGLLSVAACLAQAHGLDLGLQVTVDLPEVDWAAAPPTLLGDLHAALTTDQHGQGAYYTPLPLARRIARLTLDPLPGAPTILDPAMGCGHFLLAAGEALAERLGSRAAALPYLHGIDRSPLAVELAALTLTLWAGEQGGHLCCADALLEPPTRTFDAVVGNPPFLSVFTRARTEAATYRSQIKEQYSTARGSFDLSVPFVEMSLNALRPGGRCGLVLPNKLLAADYARPLREFVRQNSRVDAVLECGDPFEAYVYPVGLVLEKGDPAGALRVLNAEGDLLYAGQQSDLAGAPGGVWVLHREWPALRDLIAGCPPLGERAAVSAGMTVGEAYDLQVEEGGPGSNLLTTGLIRRYESQWGQATCRFLKQRYDRPTVRLETLSERCLATAQAEKIVLAGLSRRPRALLDSGEALPVVSTIVIRDAAWPLAAVCGLLNSDLMARIVRALYRPLALSGGYLRLGKREISRLPLPDVPGDHPQVVRLSELVQRRVRGETALEEEIDAIVMGLFAQQR